jgi:hypothetical protein
MDSIHWISVPFLLGSCLIDVTLFVENVDIERLKPFMSPKGLHNDIMYL